jgi:type IV conjugative transfer system coupling protein TraD
MNILSNIVRGGQLSLHGLRMFRQVLNLLLLWAGFVFFILFTIGIWQNTTIGQWIGYRDYQTANILCSFMMKNRRITVNFDNVTSSVTAEAVRDSSYFQSYREEINTTLIESGVFSLKASVTMLVMVSIFFIYRGYRKTGERYKRGAQLNEFEKIKGNIIKNNKSYNYDAYKIANMPYPYQGEMQHTLVVGANGAGKTVLISDIVEQIRNKGDKAIIYDKKGDYTKWFYDPKKDKILNPFDKRTEEWSLLSEISNIGSVKQMARAFIPEKEHYAGEGKIWDEAGRIAFTEVVNKFHAQGRNLTNREIVDQILRQDLSKVAKLLENTYGQATVDMNSPKTAAGVLFVLAAHFNSLRLTNSKQSESFSIRDWVLSDKKDSILFITSKEDLSSELAPLQTAWFEVAISAILSKDQEEEQKTWVIIDELPSLHKIPSLDSGLAMARSYHGCFVLGMQNISQIRAKYGKDTSQSISSECNTRCIFKSNDADTAKWMSDNIGQTEVTEFKEGLSYGANTIRDGVNVSTVDKVKPVFLASEILSMERLNLILKMPDNPSVKVKINYKKRKVNEKIFIKNQKLIDDLKSIYLDIAKITKSGSKGNDNNKSKEGIVSSNELNSSQPRISKIASKESGNQQNGKGGDGTQNMDNQGSLWLTSENDEETTGDSGEENTSDQIKKDSKNLSSKRNQIYSID